MNRLKIMLLGSVGFSTFFALLNISFKFDFSALAFPLSALFSIALGLFVCVPIVRRSDASKLPVVRKLLQYYPFVLLASFIFRRAGEYGTSHAFDVVCVFVWLIASALSLVVLFFLNPKRVFMQNPDFSASHDKLPKNKKKGLRRAIFEIFDWVDAFIQAAFTVALINIFILQLYAIPSESMVPEFLVGDRVISFKTASGPTFPLSDVALPQLRSYKRGDIVIFKNPHYGDDRKSQIQTFLSQLVYMLTFTTVNMNVDADGNIKADPLVKRIVGVPGEQLVMVDGALYSRTQEHPKFELVKQDSEWARWNLNTLPADIRKQILDLPLSQAEFDAMLAVEKQRVELDFPSASKECLALSQRFITLKHSVRAEKEISSAALSAFFTPREMFEYMLFADNDGVTRRLLSLDGGSQWFTSFMTDWAVNVPNTLNPYQDSMYRLNILIKLTVGRLIVRNAELIVNSVSAAEQMRDTQRNEIMAQASNLNAYVMLVDRRNMSVYPPSASNGDEQYLTNKHYFVMGDNRFNSLDLRHSYETKLIPVTEWDKYSVTYYSNLSPQSLPAKNILGTTLLRFWPISRFGIPGNTVKTGQ